MAENEAARCQLNTLADFAFYAGVGIKTTMGMGQTRRVVK
jgi:CRISPR-associated endoribonuclease Cas6